MNITKNRTDNRFLLYERTVSIFLLILGVSMIGVWTLLFFTGAAEFTNNPNENMALMFHLGSELLLAVLALLTGIYLLYSSKKAHRGLFFTLGLAIGSTFNALVFYFFSDFNLVMLIILGLFFILSAAAFIAGLFTTTLGMGKHRMMYKFGLFLLGLMVYFLLNTATIFAVPGSWFLLGQVVLFVILILAYAAALVSQTNELANG